MNKYDVYGEMIKILMVEDGLNLLEAQETISYYYNIPLNKLRRGLLKTKYYNFAFNYTSYNKAKGKFVNNIVIIRKSKKILNKMLKIANKRYNINKKDFIKGLKLLLKEKNIEDIIKGE